MLISLIFLINLYIYKKKLLEYREQISKTIEEKKKKMKWTRTQIFEFETFHFDDALASQVEISFARKYTQIVT